MKTKSKLKSYSPSNAAACSPVLARVSRPFTAWKKNGRIIGIVDYYGAVHSRIAKSGDDHNMHFGSRMHKCWDFADGRLWHGWIEDEDREAIFRHLKRKYRIQEMQDFPENADVEARRL